MLCEQFIFIAENDISNIHIDNSFFPLLQNNKQFHMSKDKNCSIPSFSDKVSMESVQSEDQGKISIDKLFQHYIQNIINLTLRYFTLQLNI